MSIDNRRTFLKQAIGGTVLIGLASQLSFSFDDEITSELALALSVWKENETSTPSMYINKKMMHESDLKKIIQEEFSNLMVLEVNGLVLSKLEVAFLAALAIEKVPA